MKILLVNPGSDRALKKENLGLAYLAACLEQKGHCIKIADEVAGENALQSVEIFHPDLVGVSFMTMYAPRAYAIADAVRKRGIPVLFGGAHPTALPEEAIQHADLVIRGEAERTLPELLEAGTLEGIVDAKPEMDLDTLPFPDRSKLNLDFYCHSGEEIAGLSYRTLGLITSRGCPYHCEFCINSRRETPLRFHGVDRVIEEIQFLASHYPIQAIAFYDELMATDIERFRAICEAMIAKRLNHLRWECQAHARLLNPELLPLMKRAGCEQVAIGFESGSQRILDLIKKNSTPERNLEIARKVKEAGMRLRGCFVIGTPGETHEDIAKTEKFIRDARIDFASIHFLTPYPGTALFERYAEAIGAKGTSWEKFTTGDPDAFICNDVIPPEEQKKIYEQLCARQAFRNYSWCDMARRALKNPRHALHVAAKLLRG